MATKRVLTLILGGGAGTRLYPLTKVRAKPAVPLAGKYRLVDIAISNCINSGIRKIFVLTQYLSASLNRHISQTYKFDDFSDGFVDILAAEQKADSTGWYEGTADAVRKTWQSLDNHECDLILILPGDALYSMDYRPLLEQHLKSEADVTIGVNTVDRANAHHFGLVKLDPWGRIFDFVEKPKSDEARAGFEAPKTLLDRYGLRLPLGDTFLASMGVYLFNRSTLDWWLRETKCTDFGKEIIPSAIKQNRISSYVFSGYWEDIGTIEAFYEAHMQMLEDQPPFDFSSMSGQTIFTRSRNLPNSFVVDTKVSRALISPGVRIIGANISRSVVGLRSRVGAGSSVEDSIVMGNDYFETEPRNPVKGASAIPVGIGEGCHIRRAIVDKNVRMGNNVRILNEKNVQHADHDLYVIRGGIVIIPKDTVLPDGTVV
ncbi:MAG: glucose-1-phosphate adenylyltransferase [Candidatus Sumerlaeia bacterium]|nr:glucose-1-phosphate adenylyltransferase [Candidatus Sumerlaeia bacterium]